MRLLNTYEAKQIIAEEVSNANEHLQIISAFCKISALEFIDEKIKNSLKTKKLMVRFLLTDILQGACDFQLYEYCKSHGWQMYIRFDLHAKTYVFDRKRCILGSANLTNKGLGLGLQRNYELSSFAEVDDSELAKLDKLFDDAILMTDQLFEIMKQEYEEAKRENNKKFVEQKWSCIVERQFSPRIEPLFTYDFPNVSKPDFEDIDSFEFLELSHIHTKEEAREAFRWSKSFLWLYNTQFYGLIMVFYAFLSDRHLDCFHFLLIIDVDANICA